MMSHNSNELTKAFLNLLHTWYGVSLEEFGESHNQPEAGTLGPHYKNERERDREAREKRQQWTAFTEKGQSMPSPGT